MVDFNPLDLLKAPPEDPFRAPIFFVSQVLRATLRAQQDMTPWASIENRRQQLLDPGPVDSGIIPCGCELGGGPPRFFHAFAAVRMSA